MDEEKPILEYVSPDTEPTDTWQHRAKLIFNFFLSYVMPPLIGIVMLISSIVILIGVPGRQRKMHDEEVAASFVLFVLGIVLVVAGIKRFLYWLK